MAGAADQWQVEAVLEGNWLEQVTGYGCGGFYLLVKIARVDFGVRISSRMVVRVKVAMVILDLDGCGYSTLTEWTFIPSATIRIYLGR